ATDRLPAKALRALLTRPFGAAAPSGGAPCHLAGQPSGPPPVPGDRVGPLPTGTGRGHNVARNWWFGHGEKDGVLDRVAGVRAGRGRLGRRLGPAVCSGGPFLVDPGLLVAVVPGVSGDRRGDRHPPARESDRVDLRRGRR